MSPETINGLWGLGGAICGAALGASGTAIAHRWNRTRLRLDALFSTPGPIIDTTSAGLSRAVTVSVNGTQVPGLYASDWVFLNSGNKAIHDISIQCQVEQTDILDVFPLDPEQRTHATVRHTAKLATIEIPFLNAKESYVVRSLLSSSNATFLPRFRQPDVEFRVIDDRPRDLPLSLVIAEMILSTFVRKL